MVRFMVTLVCIGFVSLIGCQSAQEREAEAKAQIAEEKAKLMKKYTACLEKHEEKGDAAKHCGQYKDAASPLFKAE